MKRILILTGLTIIIFLGLTLLTAKIETPLDGNDVYGFPLTFYKVFGGKRTYYPQNEFFILKFILDVLTAFLFSFIILTIASKLRSRLRKIGT